MLSDSLKLLRKVRDFIRLNALSSIVCFLTTEDGSLKRYYRRGSQCPLEHCMLSDSIHATSKQRRTCGLNALSSIVCFLTSIGTLSFPPKVLVSMPSRALYAF